MNYSDLSTEQQMIAEAKKFVNSKQREITQAEYDALSVEEKNNGTIYFIIDSENPSVDTYTKSEIDELTNNKVDKIEGKGLSTNDYTTTEKTKLAGILEGATQTVANPADTATETLSKLEVGGVVYDVPQGASGATELSELTDVNLSNVEDNNILQYDDTANKWKNSNALQGSKTATGNPITLTDAAPVNAVNLNVDLEPVQDLHGYDHPWVGGAGKNKWDEETIYGYRVIENGLYYYDANELCSKNLIPVSPSTSYRLVGGGNAVITYNSNQERISGFFISPGAIFTTPSDCYYIHFNIGGAYGNVYNHDVGIIYPSSETSYAPYSNICPISGRSEVAIQRDGKNLFDGLYPNIGSTIQYKAVYVGDGEFTLETTAPHLEVGGACVLFLLAGNVDTGAGNDTNGVYNEQSRTVTALNGYVTIAYRVYGNINPVNYETILYKTTDRQTYTIQIGQTVYGGTLDVTKGKMVVDKGYVEFDGSSDEAWSSELTVNNVYRKKLNVPSNMKLPSSNDTAINALSNQYVCKSANATYLNQIGFSVQSDGTFFAVYDSQFYTSDTSLWTTYLASNPLQVVYELAEPYTIQLTPQQIKMLENTNTLYTDYEGDTITIEYQPNNAIGEAVRVVEESYDAELEYLKPTGSISSGDTKAVTGGVVYDYHNTTPLNPKDDLYIEKSGNVINIEARDVDGSAFTSYPGAGGYTLPTGYIPKRILIVCVYVYTTYDNKNHHGIIKIRDDGTMDGYFLDFSGNEHRIYDSSYRSEVSFNTSYIV